MQSATAVTALEHVYVHTWLLSNEMESSSTRGNGVNGRPHAVPCTNPLPIHSFQSLTFLSTDQLLPTPPSLASDGLTTVWGRARSRSALQYYFSNQSSWLAGVGLAEGHCSQFRGDLAAPKPALVPVNHIS
jgi:hypothetical protein